jgi:hypothetical protein
MNRAQFLISIFLRQAWCTRSKRRDGHYGHRKQRFTHGVSPVMTCVLDFAEHKPSREQTQRARVSAPGHSRRFDCAPITSALPQQADIVSTRRPFPDIIERNRFDVFCSHSIHPALANYHRSSHEINNPALMNCLRTTGTAA